MRPCVSARAEASRVASRKPAYKPGFRGGRIARRWRRSHRLERTLRQCRYCGMSRYAILTHPWGALGGLK